MTNKKQPEIDKAYRDRQRQQGIVRKTVRVPEVRWADLQAICAEMREQHIGRSNNGR